MEYTDGTLKYNAISLANKSGGVLRGMITAFSGTFDNGYPININTGMADKSWHICDGNNGTPDLRGRFILGVSHSHPVGSVGGEEAHSLTPDENAPHDHDATCSEAGLHHHKTRLISASSRHDYIGASYESGSKPHTDGGDSSNTTDDGLHTHQITIGVSGKGTPHNNMPPYYTLSYIMKL